MTTPAVTQPRAPPRTARIARVALLVALGVVIGCGALVAWLVSTTGGLASAIRMIGYIVPVQVEAQGVHGALSREFGSDRLLVVAGDTRVEIHDLRATLRAFAVSTPRLDFERLSARRVEVQITPSGTQTGPPESIASPVAVSAKQLAVSELEVRIGDTRLAARAIDANIALGPDGYHVNGGFEFGAQRATLVGDLGGQRPFKLAAQATLETDLQSKHVRADLRADGSLLDFVLGSQLDGGGASGAAKARIASFESPALKSLQADIAGIDLRTWRASLPQTDLRVQADLTPDAASTTLSGQVQVVNRTPGTIDASRIPVREAKARIALNRNELRAEGVVIELPRGRASGTFVIGLAQPIAWHADVRVEGVDPAKLHSRVRPLSIDGTLRVRQAADTSFVLANLRNRAEPRVSASVDLRASAERIDLNRVELSVGSGKAMAAGRWELTGAQRVALKGALDRIEPSLLVKGIDAAISGEFDVDAQLEPRPSGQLRFELKDSQAYGRPLTGRGRVALDAANQLDLDIALAARSARLSAQGGLGSPARSLAIAIDAPALQELVPALSGALKANATLTGDWSTPAIEASAVANDLRFAGQSVQEINAAASYSGGADGRFMVKASAANHVFRERPELSLRAAKVSLEGPSSSHEFVLEATTAGGHDAQLVAQGGWENNAWHGTVREATIGAPLHLRLSSPAPLALRADAVEIGPAAFSLAGARLDDVRFVRQAERMITSGRFSGLRPTDLVGSEAGDGASALRSAAPDTLTLRGQWQLRIDAQVNGSLLVERSGGDLYAGNTPDTALQLRDARLEANVQANRLDARAIVTAERAGSVNATLAAFVESAPGVGWRLAQKRPLQVDAAVDVPSLALISKMLGTRVRANVRLDGRLAGAVKVVGTPEDPQASGTFNGDALRVAWVEQGMRLENGRLRARLDGDVIVLDELRFAGSPRTRPPERRVAERIRFDQEGTVSASGRLRLRDFEGVIQIAADRFPLLQRPDRWVVASGGANIEISLKRVQLNGAVVANAGYVDFSKTDLPTLSSDVVVVRPSEKPAKSTPRVAVGFDLGIDLGDAFYLRGSGLDTRVVGAVRLRSVGGGTVSAFGVLEAKDGIYQGFGQRLAISNGRLNFQGPPESPGLDVLAIRQGLPVQVGVTITRTAANPLIRLYSDPPMADQEALSWLVLGRAADQSGGDKLALAQAVAGLLSGSDEGISGRLTRSLGIDEISLRTGDTRGTDSLLPRRSVAGSLRGDTAGTTTAEDIVTIGKRVNDAIRISYEHAMSGTVSIVQLSYQLSRRVSLVTRAGTENALQLVYSFAFD